MNKLVLIKNNYYIETADGMHSTISFSEATDIIMGYCAIKKEELSNSEARKDHPMGKLCLSLIAYIGIDIYGIASLSIAQKLQIQNAQLLTHKKFLTETEKDRNPLVVYITQLITNPKKPEPLKKIPGENDNGYQKCTLTNGISVFLKASDEKLFCNADGYFVETIFGVTFPYKKEHYKANHIELILKKRKENKNGVKEETILNNAIEMLSLSKNEEVKSIIQQLEKIKYKCQKTIA